MPYDASRHGPHRIVGPGFHEKVYRLVKQIPAGSISSYGDIAAALGLRSVARHVGHALSALPSTRRDIPWHRVVNAAGRISLRADGAPSEEQARLLTAEGLAIDERGRVQHRTMHWHVFRRARKSVPSARDEQVPRHV